MNLLTLHAMALGAVGRNQMRVEPPETGLVPCSRQLFVLFIIQRNRVKMAVHRPAGPTDAAPAGALTPNLLTPEL